MTAHPVPSQAALGLIHDAISKRRPLALRLWASLAAMFLCFFAGVAGAQTSASMPQTQGVYPAALMSEGGGVRSRIEVLGQVFTSPYPIGADQSRIMLYRAAASPGLGGATSVFVDGRYHTSLVPGAWSALCYRIGAAEIGARQMLVGAAPKDRLDTITALQLQGGQTHYLRVQEEQGRPVLQPVSAAQAHQEMSLFKEQVHTVSRVAQACRESVAPVAPVATIATVQPGVAAHRITLPADTLFAFNRSDAAGMTSSGMAAIDNMLAMLKADFSQVDGMHVIGHADPLGNAQDNERLATARAHTVARHLQIHGPQGVSFTTEGRGDRDPVISTCGRQITPRSIACNQPNRRVVVEVTGTHR